MNKRRGGFKLESALPTLWWGLGLILALLVKVAGLTVGGWLSGLGLILLSTWLPSLAEISGPMRWPWRQRGRTWLLVTLTGLLWLPLGWGGYLATLQASVQLPASFQNVIFNTRYDWLPVVGPLWAVAWLYSFKWLPSIRQQLQRPTSFRDYLSSGWHTAWWSVVKKGLRLVPWLLGWLVAAGLFVGLVWLLEAWHAKWGYPGAIISSTGLQLAIWWGLWCWWSHYWPQTRRTKWGLWMVLIVAVVGYNAWWLQPHSTPLPAVVAHRGVDGHNGVQNTTSALKRTVKQTRPAMVEMDIQPTLDQHWVVMHDPTLKHLADRPGTPQRYRLKQLDGITLSENGRQGHLSSFKQYLTVAEKLHQPLLVEIKALGPANKMMGVFGETYSKRLKRDHSAVHSLDYQVILNLKQRYNHVRVGWITPFYLANVSHSVADFYSLQALTATREQVNALHKTQHAVYFWTVDRPFDMARLSAMGADGLITNQPGKLRQLQAKPPHYFFYQLINQLLSWL